MQLLFGGIRSIIGWMLIISVVLNVFHNAGGDGVVTQEEMLSSLHRRRRWCCRNKGGDGAIVTQKEICEVVTQEEEMVLS